MNLDINWLIGLHIPSAIIPAGVLWFANILFVILLLYVFRSAPLKKFVRDTAGQHVYFGAMVMLLLIWGIKAGISPGLGFHQLGATLFTLMFDWPLAIIGLTVILIASIAVQMPDWLSLGINGLVSIIIPVMTSYAILKLSQKFLPDNFFIYVFVCAFFGGGIAVAISHISAIVLLSLVHAYPDTKLVHESLMVLPLIMFPEAFLTGMLISIFVVYKPEWVVTFDDERYIIGK